MNGQEENKNNMEGTQPLEQRSPEFNWGQVVLTICVVMALILAGWNAFSIMGMDEEMRWEDSELSSEIGAVDAELSDDIGALNASINALDNETNGRIDALGNRISDVDNRLTGERNALLDKLNRLNETLQGEIDGLQNRVGVIEGDITQIDSDIDSIQADIQALQDQIDALKGRVVVLEQACDFDNDGVLDKYDYDDDNDGRSDTDDAFPNDATEWADNDNDGIGDNADPDDDNDGYPDVVDLLPYKDAVIRITVISFTLEDANDDVYFTIVVNWDWDHALRSFVFWDAPNGYEVVLNWDGLYDVPDDGETATIEIFMLDEDIDAGDDYLDIEGKSASYWLYLDYNIVTQTWSGDDDDGYSSGFDDGRTGESDVLFSYNIETI